MGADPCLQGRTCPPIWHWGVASVSGGPAGSAVSSVIYGGAGSPLVTGRVAPRGVVQAGQAACGQDGRELRGCELFGRVLRFLRLCCWEDAEL